jgi:hypothetical protein
MSMSLVFVDGTSHYDAASITQKWESGSVTSMSSTVRHGSGTSIEGPSALVKNYSATAEVIVGCAFRAPSVGGAESIFKIRLQDNSADHVELRLLGANVQLRNGDGTQIALGSTTIASGEWHYYELAVLISNTVGTYLVHVDGVEEFTGSATDTANHATETSGGVMLTSASNFFSDLYVKTGTAYSVSDFYGDIKIITLRPEFAGTDADWTIGGDTPAATNHESQDDATADETTTLVSSNSANERDTYEFEELDATVATVKFVQMTAQWRKDDTASRTATLTYQAAGGGTYYDSSPYTLPADWTMDSRILETSPITATDWTRAEVNNGRWGIKLAT